MTDEIKPCPFCGGEAKQPVYYNDNFDGTENLSIERVLWNTVDNYIIYTYFMSDNTYKNIIFKAR